jgi:hypothetical protein
MEWALCVFDKLIPLFTAGVNRCDEMRDVRCEWSRDSDSSKGGPCSLLPMLRQSGRSALAKRRQTK